MRIAHKQIHLLSGLPIAACQDLVRLAQTSAVRETSEGGMSCPVFIGWDPRELVAWNVAKHSLQTHALRRADVHRLALPELVVHQLYTRPTDYLPNGGYLDTISDAPMSTGHAIARFLVPYLCGYEGWALFTDGDTLWRDDLARLLECADPAYAVQVVQHRYVPLDTVKMDAQIQTRYARKNWSSVMLFNCGHPANRALSVHLVNTVPGRDLHRFCWLDDALVGTLPARWNVLIGHSSIEDAALVHFTEGVPDMPGYEHQPFADEWYDMARACGYMLPRPVRSEAIA